MPFIGQEPLQGSFHKLDDITTSATATYNLLLNGGAFTPGSANQLLVSLNGVIQSPGSSFTISGSQITFASALTSSDNIDFIMSYGDVLNAGVPSAGAVSGSHIANGVITDAHMHTNLDLSGKTVTYGLTSDDIPAGTMVQIKGSSYQGSVSTTGTTYVASGLYVDITPKFSNSKFLAVLSGGNGYNGGGAVTNEVFTAMFLSIGGATAGHIDSNAPENYSWDLSNEGATSPHGIFAGRSNHSVQSMYTASATTSLRFEPYFKKNTTWSGTAYFTTGGAPAQLTVMEIKQ